jgi:predicted homoserine dehydrogenase-like protein
MIIVDAALKARAEEGKPIRVAIIGAGVMARGITRQIARKVPGMTVVAVAARRIDQARLVFVDAGMGEPVEAGDAAAVTSALAAGRLVITSDHIGLGAADGIDVVVEATGSFEYAAEAMVAAIEGRKHVVLVNAELDGTVGVILKAKADAAGVCYTAADGDQPGVTMNLARHVTGMGLKVVLAGNIKGLQDRYRTPETQRAFAERWGLKPYMVTSFADGTKISFEQAVTANGLGMGVARRGMVGPDYTGGVIGATPQEIDQCIADFAPHIDPTGPGIVDYVVGAKPGPGIFVLATCDDAATAKFLAYMKMGDGPLYCFYVPYHLCHLEVPNSIARAVLFRDATLAPLGAPTVGVIACAKKDLAAGDIIDPIGGFMTYGQCENERTILSERLLPIGLAEGCQLKRPIAKDGFLTLADVELPQGRLIDRLYAEQSAAFFGVSSAA